MSQGPRHPFSTKLNEVLSAAGFDAFVERQRAPLYRFEGRPGTPAGVHFRMLFVSYFEGIDSQRSIDWRCTENLAPRTHIAFSVTEDNPVHLSMTMIRKRLYVEVFIEDFRFVLGVLQECPVLRDKTIVRKDTGEVWDEYLPKLAAPECIENPTDEDLRRMDRKRKGKKVSNQDWRYPTGQDSQITRMKAGRTQLAYKTEHAVDLESGAIVDAEVHPAAQRNQSTGPQALQLADQNVAPGGSQMPVTDLLAEKGYHDNTLLTKCAVMRTRIYIPERKQKSHSWTDKSAEFQEAIWGNRRRKTGERQRQLSRWRSERCKRPFAHACETRGGRRAWVRVMTEVTHLHRMRSAAYNLGLLLRKVFGMAKPRCAEAAWAALPCILALLALVIATTTESRNTDLLAVSMFGTLLFVVLGIPSQNFLGTRIPNFGVF